jgi:isoleucyl-tRNA synthetase
VLVELSKVLAPVIPFLTERIYRNLVACWNKDAPESVHLCDYPKSDAALLDPELNRRMALAQLVVKLGHKLREDANQRVRQPLAELQFACADASQVAAIESLADVIRDELNVKQITARDNLDDLVHYSYKPNLKTLGPKYGKLLGAIREELPRLDAVLLAQLRQGQQVTATIGGGEVVLLPDDVLVSTEQAADWVCADERGVQIALSTKLTPELKREGIARDFVRQVQQIRKDLSLEIEDHIRVTYHSDSAELTGAVEEWSAFIRGETLADSLAASPSAKEAGKQVTIGDGKMRLAVTKA